MKDGHSPIRYTDRLGLFAVSGLRVRAAEQDLSEREGGVPLLWCWWCQSADSGEAQACEHQDGLRAQSSETLETLAVTAGEADFCTTVRIAL